MATNFGAKECFSLDQYHEIMCEKEDFYRLKSEFEKKIDNYIYSGIEWRPINYLNLSSKEQNEKVLQILENLEELDDVQNVYTNVNLKSL